MGLIYLHSAYELVTIHWVFYLLASWSGWRIVFAICESRLECWWEIGVSFYILHYLFFFFFYFYFGLLIGGGEVY
ncbi:uncharacterized protein BDW47DRAFT_108939 [Aspergillus candidus]|uniref:Uncharacterized protein n=1 Tax=Aspergillus candidus TaxID=41067 RepID=A0A2I2F6I6_ASPCN|nr:hypothetical protein BDW47DRAFT_108939 [Aspergillus candidus]PLB36196.1 hypothetical protein BDW47DRAFT_108939 [Aspergillus candidus]